MNHTREDRVPPFMSQPDLEQAIGAALEIAMNYGGIDGAHHKQWVIDQMVRVLTNTDYPYWIAEYNDGEDGPNTYEWDVGVAP